MYENPKLTRVGEVEDVVLGIYAVGDDIDGFFIDNPFEFASDSDPDSE